MFVCRRGSRVGLGGTCPPWPSKVGPVPPLNPLSHRPIFRLCPPPPPPTTPSGSAPGLVRVNQVNNNNVQLFHHLVHGSTTHTAMNTRFTPITTRCITTRQDMTPTLRDWWLETVRLDWTVRWPISTNTSPQRPRYHQYNPIHTATNILHTTRKMLHTIGKILATTTKIAAVWRILVMVFVLLGHRIYWDRKRAP